MLRTALEPLSNYAPNKAKQLMGKILDADAKTIKLLPKNTDFIDRAVSSFVDESIRKNENIVFHGMIMKMHKFGFNELKLVWRGIGEDGRAMILIVDGAYQTIYVRKPDDKSESDFKAQLPQLVDIQGWKILPIEWVYGKRSVYYEENKTLYARIKFITFISGQYKITSVLKDNGYDVSGCTFTGNKSHLQVVQENNHINPSAPLKFKFKTRGAGKYSNYMNANGVAIFIVNIKDIEQIKTFTRKSMQYPRHSMLSYDLETYAKEKGQAIYGDRDDSIINVIGATMRIDKKDVFRFALTTLKKVKPIPNTLVIRCVNQREIAMVYATIQKMLMPEFVLGYNTSNFDWNFLKHKLFRNGSIENFLAELDIFVPNNEWWKKKPQNRNKSRRAYDEYVWEQYQYYKIQYGKNHGKRSPFKISVTDITVMEFPFVSSFIDYDLMFQLAREHPKSKRKLDDFLEAYGLAQKYNMSYDRMHSIGEAEDKNCTDESHISDCTDLITYCIHDTIAVLDLCDKSELLDTSMTLATITNTTYRDTIMNPPAGVAMDSLVISAVHQGYFTGTEEKPDSHNPGGHVFHPVRQLYIPKLSIAERKIQDPRWFSVSDIEVNEMYAIVSGKKENPDVSPVALELFNEFMNEENRNPLAPQDFGSMYPHVMLEDCLSSELAVKPEDAYKFPHLKLIEKKFNYNGNESHMFFVMSESLDYMERGLIPAEQFKMFHYRKAARKEQKVVMKRTDICEDEKEFMWKKLESKQLAYKVIMNSYYGKMGENYGSENSTMSLPIIGSATAYGGQERLKFMAAIIKSEGWDVKYGDTDSCYPMVPDKYLEHLHVLYYSGQMTKMAYVSAIIEESAVQAHKLERIINDGMRKKYPFMYVESEGILYPAILIRKKKYCGIKNEGAIMIGDDGGLVAGGKYFQRNLGERLTKLSKFARILSKEMYSTLLNIYNTKSFAVLAREIISQTLKRAESGEYADEMFIKTTMLRTGKDNKGVKNFFEFLRSQGRKPPDENVKFSYVLVRRDNEEFNANGNINKMGKAGYMELYDYFKENKANQCINFSEYLSSDASGELGQFICADKDLIIDDTGDIEKDEADTAKKGKKFIENLCAELTGKLPTKFRKPVYTGIYKKVASKFGKVTTSNGLLARKLIERETLKGAERVALILFRQLGKMPVKELIEYQKTMNRKVSAKTLIAKGNEKLRADLINQLDEICDRMDDENNKLALKLAKAVDTVKEKLNLNKPVISKDEYENALAQTDEVIASIEVGEEYPEPCKFEYFDIVDRIVFLDKHVASQDKLAEKIKCRIAELSSYGSAVKGRAHIYNNLDNENVGEGMFDQNTDDDVPNSDDINF